MANTNKYDVQKAVVAKLSRRQIFVLCLFLFLVLFLAVLKSPEILLEVL